MFGSAPDIESRLVGTEPICIVAGAHHELSSERLYDCSELIKYPWIGFDLAAPLAVLLNSWFEEHSGRTPLIKLRTSSSSSSSLVTVATLCNTDCLSMLPSSVFKHLSSDTRIKKIKTSSSLTLGGYSAH